MNILLSIVSSILLFVNVAFIDNILDEQEQIQLNKQKCPIPIQYRENIEFDEFGHCLITYK